MNLSEIDPHSERGEAYREAKANPGRVVEFQTEHGLSTVKYRKPVTPHHGDLIYVEGTPGYWYEKPKLDLTNVMQDARELGFRVYDEEEDDG